MKLTRHKRDFYNGMLAALAVVASADQETLYREIVETADEKELVAVALSDEGTAEWSGLVRYGYCAKNSSLRVFTEEDVVLSWLFHK